MNCEKFEFFGFETRDECLHEQENYHLTTIAGQTKPINDGNTGKIMGITIFSIIAFFGFILGVVYLIRYLIIRKIVGLFTSAMSRPYKPSQTRAWKKPSLKQLMDKLRLDRSDLSKINKIFAKTESEVDLEAVNLKVSNIFYYFCFNSHTNSSFLQYILVRIQNQRD